MKNFTSCLMAFMFLFPVLVEAKRRAVPKLPPKPQLTAPFSETEMTRVDPHGAKNIKPTNAQVHETPECQVCHGFENDKLITKPNALNTCFNCHNHSPHSGVEEHLVHHVQCTDCHTFHRGEGVAWKPSSGLFKGLHGQALAEGLQEKTNPTPMLKKTCTDCHK